MKRPTAPVALAAFALAASAHAEEGTTTVHVEAPPGVILESKSMLQPWKVSCVGSCDQPMPLGTQYRVDGSGIQPSKPFLLVATNGRSDLSVSTRSSAWFVFGVVLGSIGAAASTFGLGVDVASLTLPGDNADAAAIGGFMAVIGALVALPGIILAVTQVHSKVHQVGGVALSPRAPLSLAF